MACNYRECTARDTLALHGGSTYHQPYSSKKGEKASNIIFLIITQLKSRTLSINGGKAKNDH